jgi:hypothetical protein
MRAPYRPSVQVKTLEKPHERTSASASARDLLKAILAALGRRRKHKQLTGLVETSLIGCSCTRLSDQVLAGRLTNVSCPCCPIRLLRQKDSKKRWPFERARWAIVAGSQIS